jgi:NTP pyrophosphatase (non-canonical NTP hydrolase)
MTDPNELQLLMERTYGERDRVRGMTATVAWLAEEMGAV